MRSAGALAGTAAAVSLAGCSALIGDDGEEVTDPETGQTFDLEELPEVEATYAHALPETAENQAHTAAQFTKEYVENATGGRFQIDIVGGGAIGDVPTHIEQTQAGAVEMSNPAAFDGALPAFYPNIMAVSQPYIYPNLHVAEYVWENTEFGEMMKEDIREQLGMRLYFQGMVDYNQWTSSEELTSIDDIEGMTMRTMAQPAHQEIVRQLGGSPEVVEWTELYEAMDAGVVDGHDNPIPTVLFSDFHEVQDYIYVDDHVLSFEGLFVNDDWYEGLHPLYQSVLDAGALVGSREYTRSIHAYGEIGEEVLEERGMEINYASDEEIEEIRNEIEEPVADFIRDEVDDEEWVDRHEEAVETAIEELGYDMML